MAAAVAAAVAVVAPAVKPTTGAGQAARYSGTVQPWTGVGAVAYVNQYREPATRSVKLLNQTVCPSEGDVLRSVSNCNNRRGSHTGKDGITWPRLMSIIYLDPNKIPFLFIESLL